MKRFNYKGRSASVNSHALHDEGLRQYFLAIYTLMSAGLFITALSAFAVFTIPALTGLMFNISPEGYLLGMTMVGMLISFSPLVISVYFAFKLADLSVDNTRLLFFIFATLMGASLGSLGFIYTGASITKTFLICSSMFGTMSIYGYSTKKDLTSMGSFLFMGLIGLSIFCILSIFRFPVIIIVFIKM